MRKLLEITTILVIVACNQTTSKMENSSLPQAFYVGTYTESASEGIYKYRLKKDGLFINAGLMAKTDNPSYLCFNAKHTLLLAVNELEKGRVESFIIKHDTLIKSGSSSSGGAHPCFIASNSKNFVLTANYSSGTVALMQITPNGKISGLLDVQQHFGKGTHPRQESPHAHSAWFVPNSNTVIVADLGTNALWFYTIDTVKKQLIPQAQHTLKMQAEAGPRHLAFHPNAKWIYVVNELNGTVSWIIKQQGNYKLAESVSTLPQNFNAPNTSADIHLSPDGQYLYVSNRGHNSLAIFKINSDGILQLIGHESTHGDGPRNFAITSDGNFIVVANQYTQNLVSFKRNLKTGQLTYLSQIKAPTPVCILFENN